jgi:HEPN domain-containing protein
MTDKRKIIINLTTEWLRWAQADMTVASMTDDERIAPEILAFHAQQAVEKILKALLVLRQIDFPHIHSIGALLALCEKAGFVDAQELADAGSLTRYAVASRYPGEEAPVNREEAKEAVLLAAKVLAWGTAHIHKAMQSDLKL